MLKIIQTIIILAVMYVGIQLVGIIGGAIFDFASLMVPDNRPADEQINDALHDCANWFHKQSGRTDAQREASHNAAGLYYNPNTGRYEEDQERFSRELDAKYGHNQE